MAPDSKTLTGSPPGPSESTIAGILLFGLMARNSGLNWSPLPRSIQCSRYSNAHSPSMTWIFCPFGVAAV